MLTINANTKIAAILKAHPDALEAIIRISPAFNKLRNPILRKVMAVRATISMAAKIGGCKVEDFFHALQPLGFNIETDFPPEPEDNMETAQPDFMQNIRNLRVHELDVRPVIESGNDPLSIILKKTGEVKSGEILLLINSFVPTPLIHLLKTKGFTSYTKTISPDLYHTWFHKTAETQDADLSDNKNDEGWDGLMEMYKNKMVIRDVRDLEMPLPMVTILEALDTLKPDEALFVYHKRIPVFLLPELRERKFDYRIREIDDAQVHMLVFTNDTMKK